MGDTGTTRRSALAGAGAATAVLLAGCTSGAPEKAPDRRAEAEAAAVRALRVRTAATSAGLLDRYDAVIARHPAQAARLRPLRDAVALHLKALQPEAPETGADPAPSGSAPTAAAGSRSVTVPADPAEAVRSLVTAERHAADQQAAALMEAPPEFARLLASVAAADAVHTYLLSQGAPA